ncbi:MAG TPA: DUF1549 domain-containing protein [Pirellulaceae bacterium]|nr:DUF1549 domain-containing protein [Pirellulaceae bacterium]
MRLPLCAAALAALTFVCQHQAAAQEPLVVVPGEVKLEGNFARAQLVVGRASSPSQAKTGEVGNLSYVSSDPTIVSVNERGLMLAVKDGQAKITVAAAGMTKDVPVTVSGVVENPVIQFSEHIAPILTKAGCAMAACHAAQHGKGGFKLSVFASEPASDQKAMVRDSLQRRIDFVQPENSLILLKPTMGMAHGGGRRIAKDSVEYQTLLAWIRGGAPAPKDTDPIVTKLHVFPKERVGQIGMTQQLRVEAEYEGGKRRDVTPLARFDSMDDGVLSVTSSGLLTTVGKGQAAVMVRYEGQADISLVVVPFADKVDLAGWQNYNFIDELAAAKFRELGIEPSPLADDATFIRRAFLDAIGTLPTPEETTAFLESTDPAKRAKLIDRLLGLTGDPAQDIYNEWYAANWSLKWSDLLRNSSRELGDQGMWALHNWIKDSFRANRPMDQFVRELITAKGSIYTSGPANFYRVNANPPEITEAVSQTLLGIRMECAKCHHHPFEKYSQDDYYSLAAFFARVGNKNSQEFGLFGREQVVMVRDSGEVSHPRTGKRMEPKPLEGEPLNHELDRRIPLAAWMTAPDNPFFARNIVNRYVGYLLGRGLVEPIDDLRSTNPPTNPALMDALVKHFVDSKFDVKQLMRLIMNSRLYQLDSQPTAANALDGKFYSHYYVKRLKAEPLLDAIDRVTGTQTKYKSLPLGTRAIELPDAEYPDYFLNTFAKPRRASVCECERSPDENLSQALHTLNGDILAGKIADANGTVAKLIKEGKSHEEVVRHLYLLTLCRPPSDAELAESVVFLDESPSAAECYQDLLWALVNSKQFLFVR